MSTIHDDKDPVQKGRKEPITDADAPLRDRIPTSLLAKCEKLELGRKVKEIWSRGNSRRQEWLKRQEEFLADWDEFLEADASGPFEHASNLHLPMPLIVAKTMHARFLQAILGIDPYFTVKARTEGMADRAATIQDLMAYVLKDYINCYDGVDEAIDLWLWDWVTAGCGILKARWGKQFVRFLDVQQVPKTLTRMATNPETGEEVPIQEVSYEEKEVPVTKVKFAGPYLEHRHPEDVLIVGGAGDPQKADAVIEATEFTASDLWTLADTKIFNEDAVKEVIEGGPDKVDSVDTTGIKQQRAANAGVSETDSDSDLDRYKVFEAYLATDVDGSGINTDIVLWVAAQSGKVLRATYLHRINKSGERPYFKIDFYKRAGQDYGIGLVEILHPLSVELDAMHNMRVDFGTLSTMPFGFYRPTSSIEPETIPLEPGSLYPLDDPQRDIYFPNLGNRTAFGFQEETGLWTYVERLTGMNDMALGVMTGAQGATRTATGARALLGESNTNLDVFLRRLHRGWKRCLKYLLHMVQQRLPQGFEFRITGEGGGDSFYTIQDAAQIAGDYDFEIAPNSANSNKQIQEEVAAQVLQAVQNPLAIQAGVVTAGGLYEAYKAWFKAKGVKDFSKFIQKPPEYRHVMTPVEEANRILRGIPTPVTPEMDHEGFLAYAEAIMGSDEMLGQFSEDAAKALAAQVQQHEQMAQALQAAAAEQANAGQMRSNAAMSQNQAPTGMSAMEGTGNGQAGG